MNKWYGRIGFIETKETVPGVWNDEVEERHYYGDIVRVSKSWMPTQESTNDNIQISNQIKIIADPYAYNHFHTMKYIEFYGAFWCIKDVSPEFPRLTISIGGVYNGPTLEKEENPDIPKTVDDVVDSINDEEDDGWTNH